MIQRYVFMVGLCFFWLTGDTFAAARPQKKVVSWSDWFKSKFSRAPQQEVMPFNDNHIKSWLNEIPQKFDPIASDSITEEQSSITREKLNIHQPDFLRLPVQPTDLSVSSVASFDPLQSSLIIPTKATQSWREWFLSKVSKNYWPNLRGYVARLALHPIKSSANNLAPNDALKTWKRPYAEKSFNIPLAQATRVSHHSCIQRIDVPVIQQAGRLNWPRGVIPGTTLQWSSVASQESGNCGYHALNNVLWVADRVAQGSNISVSEMDQQKQYFQFMGNAFPLIAQKRGVSRLMNWLGGGELEELCDRLRGALTIPILIVEHVPVEGLDFSEHVLSAVKKFAERPDSLLGIVWNSGVRGDLSSMGGSHWVSFVVQHDGDKINLYYMNSITGLHPNFSIIEKLLCNSPEQLQILIEKPARDAMKRDIARMKQNILLLRGHADGKIFKNYIGCITYSGRFLTEFTREQLRGLGLAGYELERVLVSLNRNWINYVQPKRPMALNFETKRFYGVWVNQDLSAHAFDVSVVSCEASNQKYRNSSLLVAGQNVEVVQPDTFFESMMNACLIGWKDYGVWPDFVQREVADLLVEYLSLAREHRLMIVADSWRLFGGLRAAVSDLVSKLPVVVQQRPDFVVSINRMIDNLSV